MAPAFRESPLGEGLLSWPFSPARIADTRPSSPPSCLESRPGWSSCCRPSPRHRAETRWQTGEREGGRGGKGGGRAVWMPFIEHVEGIIPRTPHSSARLGSRRGVHSTGEQTEAQEGTAVSQGRTAARRACVCFHVSGTWFSCLFSGTCSRVRCGWGHTPWGPHARLGLVLEVWPLSPPTLLRVRPVSWADGGRSRTAGGPPEKPPILPCPEPPGGPGTRSDGFRFPSERDSTAAVFSVLLFKG